MLLKPPTPTDQPGGFQNISDGNEPDSPATFRYEERGRKSKIETSRPADYRSDVAVGGFPFEVVDRAPNLPGGGSATTIYDEHDRATEVQVRDANGELVNRALRTYDAQGRVVEEKQILDNPETIIPSGVRARILEQSDLPADQLRQELRTQITMLMAGQPGAYSVSYICDTRDRINERVAEFSTEN